MSVEIKIITHCDIQLDGAVKAMLPGDQLTLPADKAQRLLDAGYAKAEPFDATRWTAEIQAMVAELGRFDPRAGIWEFIIRERPELWQAHRAAMREIGAAYQARDASRVMTAKTQALEAFNAMLAAWETRNIGNEQPSLLAA